MISPKITVDSKDLDRAIQESLKNTSRTVSQVVNSTLMSIVNKALKLTKKASVEAIRELGTNVPWIYKVIAARRREAGLPGLNNRDMALEKKKFINKRVSAVNFIRMQWKWAIADLIPFTRKYVTSVSIQKGGSRKGFAVPAKTVGTYSNASVQALGENDVKGGKQDSPIVTAIVETGVRAAMQQETQNKWEHIMAKELEENMVKPFNRHR